MDNRLFVGIWMGKCMRCLHWSTFVEFLQGPIRHSAGIYEILSFLALMMGIHMRFAPMAISYGTVFCPSVGAADREYRGRVYVASANSN
jgi:hypothetical protein